MLKAIGKYCVVLDVDEDGFPVDIDENPEGYSVTIHQIDGDELILLEQRESDDFYLVMNTRLGIGYWLHPRLLEYDGNVKSKLEKG